MLETLVFVDVIETEGATRVDLNCENGEIFSHYLGREKTGKAVLICTTDEFITDSTARNWLRQMNMQDLIPFLAPEKDDDVCFEVSSPDYDQEIKTFLSEQPRLQEQNKDGGYVAIKDSKIIGPWTDLKDAQNCALDVFGPGPCLIRDIFDTSHL